MYATNLLLDKIALQFRVFLWVSVSASLVVFAAKVYPYLLGDLASAELVAAKDVRNSFS
jgi:hypothetical protein